MTNAARLGDPMGNEVVVGNLYIGGTLDVVGTETRNGNFTVSKATPVLEVQASTDTIAEVVVDGGNTTDSTVRFQNVNVDKWTIGNDGGSSDAFVISAGGALGTTNALSIANATRTISFVGNVDQSGAATFSTGTGAVSLNGTTTLALGKNLVLGDSSDVSVTSGDSAIDFSGGTGLFKTTTGTVTVGPGAVSLTGDLTVATAKSLLATGTAAADFSGGSGIFKTTTGNVTVGPGAVTVSGDTTLTKATPILEVRASTDTKASIVVDALTGTTGDGVLSFEANNVAKWALGRDASNTDAFVLARSGVLETTPVITITQATGAVSLAGNVSFAGAETFGTGTGAVSLNGDTTIAGAKTFTTGTGAIALNGDVTIAGAKTFATGTGAVSLNGDSTLSKATPILEVHASTDTGATVVVDGGETADSVVEFQNNNVKKWVMGNDATGDGFAIAPSVLGTNNILSATTAEVTIPTGVTLDITDAGGLQLANVSVAATAAEINRAADVSTRVVNVTTTPISITEAAHEGKLIFVNMAGGAAVTFTLPVAAATGDVFRFIIGTTQAAGSCIIKVPDVNGTFVGSVNILDNDLTAQAAYSASGTDDTLTLNGTTTGGLAGDWVEFIDLGTNLWHVKGGLVCPIGSNIADIFSATV